jgi:hypothetical protein
MGYACFCFLIATTSDTRNSFLVTAARYLKLAWHIERYGARFRHTARELLALRLSRLCVSRTKVGFGGMYGTGGMMGMLWMRVGEISITVLEYSGTHAGVTRGPRSLWRTWVFMNRRRLPAMPGWAHAGGRVRLRPLSHRIYCTEHHASSIRQVLSLTSISGVTSRLPSCGPAPHTPFMCHHDDGNHTSD